MMITRKSMFTQREHTMEIDVTHEQLAAWRGGMLIQEAMPHLSADEREFIMTGVTPTEWNDTFGEHDKQPQPKETS
jgi:hypothetical protein